MTQPRAKIIGTGMCNPDRVVTNDDLAKLMNTTDEWIRQRTGIEERRYIEPGQQPADLACAASKRALDAAQLSPEDIDCIVLATLSAQADFPGTSFFLQDQLGLSETPCFDVSAQCSGFLYGLAVANGFIRSGVYRRVLVVGCEVHSTGLDLSDEGRDVAVIFGDGAGAVLLEATENESDRAGLLEIRLHAQGKFAKKLWLEAPGSGLSPHRIDHKILDERRHFPRMEGRFVFKHAVRRMPEVLLEALGAASLKLEDVDHFLFHQANLRINEFVMEQLGIPPERCSNNIQRYGNCSSASIPMLLDEAARAGRLESGQIVSMTSFGSGFSWASAVLRW
jgi:3-oxoacyl-[acyl-carrier-protein] synthase-3